MTSTATGRLDRYLRRAGVSLIALAALVRAPDVGPHTVERLIVDAEDLAHVEAFVPARAKLEAALAAAHRLGDVRLSALSLDRLGSVLEFQGHNPEGVERHVQAAALAQSVGDRRLAASIQASIGLGHWRRADYPSALRALDEGLAAQEELGDAAGQARTLDYLGRVHFKRGDYAEARASYRRALSILNTTGDRRWQSIILEDLGDLELEQGSFTAALQVFERALAARQELGDAAGSVYMQTVIGRSYLLQGAYREAALWFDRALVLSRQTGERASRALALYHMGIAQEALASPGRALAFYQEALEIKEELGDKRQQAWILMRAGDAHAARQDMRSALDRYQRATTIWEAIDDPRGTATGLGRTARAHFELAQYRESAALHRRASRLLEHGHPTYFANALIGMGQAYAASGYEAEALEHARRAVAIARRGPADVQWTTLQSLAGIERRLHHPEDALRHYRESLAVIESLRERVVPSADVRAGFLEGKQAVYGATIELLFELGRGGEALEVAERSRARAFLDQLSARDLVTKRVDPAALARIASLQLLHHEAVAGSVTATSSLTSTQIRNEARRSRQTLLEYFSGADRLFTWVISPDGAIRATSTPIGRRELADLVGGVRAAVGAGAPAGDVPGPGSSDGQPRPLLRRLHQVLIEPVAHLLPRDADRVVTIIPHGPLFSLSFAALIDPNDRYVVERHALVYSPSVSVLPYIRRNRLQPRSPRRLLAMGNPTMPEPRVDGQAFPPLPGAEQEAHAVAELFGPEDATALVGSGALERTVREVAPEHSIIHLATHAVVSDDAPMDSYLVLAPDRRRAAASRDPRGDGYLTTAEIFGLQLQAELVTLSACDTGLGRISGEGVEGLSRAFIYAGASSVLVSLWRVADSVATPTMERFYKVWIRANGSKAVALASAQRQVIASLRKGQMRSPSGRTLAEEPLLWAPFVLIGDGR